MDVGKGLVLLQQSSSPWYDYKLGSFVVDTWNIVSWVDIQGMNIIIFGSFQCQVNT